MSASHPADPIQSAFRTLSLYVWLRPARAARVASAIAAIDTSGCREASTTSLLKSALCRRRRRPDSAKEINVVGTCPPKLGGHETPTPPRFLQDAITGRLRCTGPGVGRSRHSPLVVGHLTVHPLFPAPDSLTQSVPSAPPRELRKRLPGPALITPFGFPAPA